MTSIIIVYFINIINKIKTLIIYFILYNSLGINDKIIFEDKILVNIVCNIGNTNFL